MKIILFITDRVMHYQRSTFNEMERQLARAGYELWLLSGRDRHSATGRVGLKEAVIANEVKYDFVEKFYFTYKLAWYRGVLEAIERIGPAVVVNAAHPGNVSHWQIAHEKRRQGFRLVSWLCGYEFHPSLLKDIFVRRLISHYDYHLAYHTNAKRYAVNYGALPDRVTVIHNTIDERGVSRQPRQIAKQLLAVRHPETSDKRIVLYVGAVLAEKRLEALVSSFRALGRADAALLIVGDGEHLPTIRQLVGNDARILLAGRVVDGVGLYFDAADMYVLPGTGGLGINEAMAHGLPVISGYADGSADDLVVSGRTGFRIFGNDMYEFAIKINFLLDNESEAQRMGLEAENLIRGDLSFERFVGRSIEGIVKASEWS